MKERDKGSRERGEAVGTQLSRPPPSSPGKCALTDGLPLQWASPTAPPAPDAQTASGVAGQGVAGANSALPHAETIQQLFGAHDISSTRAQVGGAAAHASDAIDANAYTYGDRVGFAAAPDLRTATHEAAHVVQQRGGHAPSGGLDTPGDHLERNADQVADAVVAGQPAEHLLDQVAGSSPTVGVQRDSRADQQKAMWQQTFQGDSVAVGKFARVSAPAGIILNAQPVPGHPQPTSAKIPLNGQIWVERHTSQTNVAERWAYVVAPESGASGFVEEHYLAIDPPEPTAIVYNVKSQQTLGAIIEDQSQYKISGGNDKRLYAQAIYLANQGRAGVYIDHVDLPFNQTVFREHEEEETLKIWLGIGVKACHAIWIPSEEFVQALKASGEITSGSTDLSKAWRAASGVVMGVVHGVEFVAGVVVGLLEGIYEAIRDIFKGAWELVKMTFEIFKAQITGTMLELIKETAGKVKDFFEKFSAKDLMKAVGSYIADRWNNSGWFGKGEFVGEIIGYVAANVLLAMLSVGGSLAAVLAEAAEAGSDIAKAVMLLVKVTDAAANPLNLLKDAGKGVEIGEEAAAKLKQGLKNEAHAAKAADHAPKPHVDPHAPDLHAPDPHAPKPTEQPHKAPENQPAKDVKDGCFVSGTLVRTMDGLYPIEKLDIGARVLATEETSTRTSVQAVMRTFIHTVPVVVELHCATAQITCSPAHPFWIPDRGWVAAGELEPGDHLQASTGAPIRLEAVHRRDGVFTVHNISVEGLATYHVSTAELLVHNKPMKADPKAMFDSRKASIHESIAEVRLRIEKVRKFAKTNEQLDAIEKLEGEMNSLERQVNSTRFDPHIDLTHYDPLSHPEQMESKVLKDVEGLEKKVAPKHMIPEDRPALDKETVLADGSGDYTRTGKTYQGRQIYRGGDGKLYYVDNLHNGAASEIEVFSASGEHLGTMSPSGEFSAAGKVKGRYLPKDKL